MGTNNEQRRIRWWPAAAVLLLGAAALLAVWLWPEASRQQRWIRTANAVSATVWLLLIWVLFLSRMRWKLRLGILGGFVLCVGAAVSMFQIKGVTGDLLPIIGPRWSGREVAALEIERAGAAESAGRIEASEASFPQFQGPSRNGIIEGITLPSNWKEHPPELMWRRPVGAAWSGFAVEGSHAITMEQRGERELVVSYDLYSGQPLWTHADETRYATVIAGEGPRSTPSIWSNLVYTVGATGRMNCLRLSTGELVWTVDLLEDNGGRLPDWGMAGSPLVHDGMVIASAGGPEGKSLAAYDAMTGKKRWAAGEGGADYSSPIVARLLGETQILHFNTQGVNAHALDGAVLWHYPWRGGHPHVAVPVVAGKDRVLISSGYGTGSALVRLERDAAGTIQPVEEWKNIRLKSKFAIVLPFEDHVYGLDDGIMTCLDLKSGQRAWKDGRYGHGQALLVDDKILLMAEKGDLVLLAANPSQLAELDRFPVFGAKTWNPPCLAGEYLILRNDREAACFKLPVEKKQGKPL